MERKRRCAANTSSTHLNVRKMHIYVFCSATTVFSLFNSQSLIKVPDEALNIRREREGLNNEYKFLTQIYNAFFELFVVVSNLFVITTMSSVSICSYILQYIVVSEIKSKPNTRGSKQREEIKKRKGDKRKYISANKNDQR